MMSLLQSFCLKNGVLERFEANYSLILAVQVVDVLEIFEEEAEKD